MGKIVERVIVDAEQPLYLRPSKAGKLLDCSRSKVYDLVRRGELRAVTIGGQLRIPRAEIEALANRPSAE